MAKPSASKTPKGASRLQFGALPWRLSADGRLQILLITSRETHRPVIPKGWPIKRLAPAFTAMREAYEEAGVEGYIGTAPVGSYTYVKRMPKGRDQNVRVEVYGLQVTTEHPDWPEMQQRTKFWVSPDSAAEMVEEPRLKALITDFHP